MLMASAADKAPVVEILIRSFQENPSVHFILGHRKNREKRLKALMEYSFDVCYESGRVYINEEKTACALVLFPDQKRTTWSSISRDARLILEVIGLFNVRKVAKRNARIARQYPRTPFFYLWFIGVSPGAQRQQHGTRLLAALIQESDRLKRPLLLETSVKRNILWYEKQGFYVYYQLSDPYQLYFLRRDVQNS